MGRSTGLGVVAVLCAPAILHGQAVALEAELARVARSVSGSVGIAGVHLESGITFQHRGDARFFMASTFKVPIAAQLLARVDRGELRLDSLIVLRTQDLAPFGSLLSQRFDDPTNPGAHLALIRYLELMLILSDNTATDVVLRAAGGPEAVTRRMRDLGIQELSVDRSTMEFTRDLLIAGARLPPYEQRSPALIRQLMTRTTPEVRQALERAFFADERDKSTPRAMATLLAKLWRGEGLSPESRRRLFSILERVETGPDRLAGKLPPGAMLGHKTGSYDGVSNDVGVLTLPADAGHVAIAVFVEDRKASADQRAGVIAHAARAVHDFFVFNPTGTGPSRLESR